MKKLKYIYFGTCSWKYDSWKGLIYPEFNNFNYLKEYSKYYSTVEIDQWFWSLFGNKIKLPLLKDVVEYSRSVPQNFKFTIKAPNSITLTHHYRKTSKDEFKPNLFFLSTELYEEFLSSIKELHPKIGLIMFQFEYLNKQKMSSQIEFLSRLKNFLKQSSPSLPRAIEIRNPNYLTESYFDFINDMGIYHVFIQGYYMPPIWNLYSKFREKIKGKVVIRLLGPDRDKIEEMSKGEWNRILFPKDNELKEVVEIIKDLEKRRVETYVNVNNHYEGSAPLTIQKIQSLI